MQAADEADDPLVLASAARSGTHALLAVGRFGDAVELGEAAELHRVSAALDLGDIRQVIESAPRISVDHLPVERRVTHLIDIARALSLVAKDEQALQTLLTAERTSPGIVRHSAVVREVVRPMYRRAPATSGEKLALAKRCRTVR